MNEQNDRPAGLGRLRLSYDRPDEPDFDLGVVDLREPKGQWLPHIPIRKEGQYRWVVLTGDAGVPSALQSFGLAHGRRPDRWIVCPTQPLEPFRSGKGHVLVFDSDRDLPEPTGGVGTPPDVLPLAAVPALLCSWLQPRRAILTSPNLSAFLNLLLPTGCDVTVQVEDVGELSKYEAYVRAANLAEALR